MCFSAATINRLAKIKKTNKKSGSSFLNVEVLLLSLFLLLSNTWNTNIVRVNWDLTVLQSSLHHLQRLFSISAPVRDRTGDPLLRSRYRSTVSSIRHNCREHQDRAGAGHTTQRSRDILALVNTEVTEAAGKKKRPRLHLCAQFGFAAHRRHSGSFPPLVCVGIRARLQQHG